jgi:hypothetical protein
VVDYCLAQRGDMRKVDNSEKYELRVGDIVVKINKAWGTVHRFRVVRTTKKSAFTKLIYPIKRDDIEFKFTKIFDILFAELPRQRYHDHSLYDVYTE